MLLSSYTVKKYNALYSKQKQVKMLITLLVRMTEEAPNISATVRQQQRELSDPCEKSHEVVLLQWYHGYYSKK